jgi:murein DD-endopeptidase MepM/ murein hydrolase activator NlpD
MLRIASLLLASGVAAVWMLVALGYDAEIDAAAPRIVMDPEITWHPERPGEGRLFRIRVIESAHTPLLGVHGSVEGEELHFEPLGDRTFESLAAVPVGSDGVVTASIRVVFKEGGEKRLERRISVAAGAYRHEELSVAPRFGAPLDAADQARLARDQALASEAARAAHRTPRIWTTDVVMPRTSRVTSGFGNGRIFNGQVSSRHMGLDLQGLHGDTVVAAARGVVQLVEPFLLAGNIVYLNHGGGLLSAYFHLSEQLVAAGDTVEAGAPVGLVGATGRVTGPHLHWVVRYGNASVDPRSLLEVVDLN